MNLPLVSIIIPTYNQRADFLRECLKSAINQTYSNIEVIVSDNHSNNEAVGVLEEFRSRAIRIVKPPQHVDIIDNFIFGAEAATGEYISFLSSDDLLYPECIAKVIQPLIDNSHLAFSYCENAIINAAGERQSLIRSLKLPSGIYPAKVIAYRMYRFPEYWVIGGILHRDHLKKIGLAKGIRAADWILGFQILKYGDVAYCNEVLSAIRFHERQGDAKEVYAQAHALHNMQAAARHKYIIEDDELLKAIGISRKQAVAYRDKEILGSVIMLTRKFHKGELSRETANKIFDVYKKTCSGLHFNFLTTNYASKLALAYTYMLGITGRISRIFSSKK